MKVKIPEPGGICQSKQGRDKDRFYLIKCVNADGTLSLVDGNYKKLGTPKIKNLKHVKLLPDKAESIAAKFADGAKIFDSEIYSALRPYNFPQDAAVQKNIGD